MHHQQSQAHAERIDARFLQGRSQLGTRQVRPAPQRALNDSPRAREGLRVEAVLAAVVRHRAVHSRPGKREHPSDVGRRDEVPGGPQNVRAQDLASIEGSIQRGVARPLHALAERPLRPRVVLRLDGAEPRNGLDGRSESRADEALIDEPPPGQIGFAAGSHA